MVSTTATDSYQTTSHVAAVKQSSLAKSLLVPSVATHSGYPKTSRASVQRLSADFTTPRSLVKTTASSGHHVTSSHAPVTTGQEALESIDRKLMTLNYPWSSFKPGFRRKYVTSLGGCRPALPLQYTHRPHSPTSRICAVCCDHTSFDSQNEALDRYPLCSGFSEQCESCKCQLTFNSPSSSITSSLYSETLKAKLQVLHLSSLLLHNLTTTYM